MRRGAILGLMVAVLLATIPPAGESATELKLGHCAGLDDPYHVGALKFAELAKAQTRDAVRVLVFPSCQLGSGERELIEGSSSGPSRWS